MLETELKFRVPDIATFERLVQTELLAGYRVEMASLVQVHDRYLDTEGGALLRGRFSCRLRETPGGVRLITIKSLEVSKSGLHVRQEMEVMLPSGVAVMEISAWPASEARDLVSDLVGDGILAELFDFRQERFQRLILDEDGTVFVELSVDRVWLGGPDRSPLLGVEAEVRDERGVGLLPALSHALLTTWYLVPESRAKFWQALEIVRPELLPTNVASSSLKGPSA